MITKKRLFKPTHQQPNRLVLAYTCESDSLAVVPDSLATARVDSLIDARFREAVRARADSLTCEFNQGDTESNPGLDPIGGFVNSVRKGVGKGIQSVAQNIAKSEAVEALKEWWNDEDENDD